MKHFCLILTLTCASTWAAPKESPPRMTNAQYAAFIAKAFSRFQSPNDPSEILRRYADETDRAALDRYLRENPPAKLPAVQANGENLRFNFNGRVQTLRVVDGPKALFSIRGVELDLSTKRPMKDRLAQIDELSAEGSRASLWDWFLPRAYAGSDGLSTAIAASGPAAAQADDYQKATDAHYSAVNLNFLCRQMVKKPSYVPVNAFNDKTYQAVRKKRDGARPVKPEVEQWEGPTVAYLEKSKSGVCRSGFWHEARKYNPFNETSEAQDEACKEIKKAITCMQELEGKKAAPLYREQYAEIVDWLKKIEPEGGKSASQLANETGVIR